MTKIITQLRKKYNKRTVNILGTEYLIRFENTETIPALNDLCGYCSYNSHEIVINQEVNYFKNKSDDWITNEVKCTLRHELIHAFFFESGLGQVSAVYNGAWAQNEEMVDWLALQSPKIFKVFNDLNLFGYVPESKKEPKLVERLEEDLKKQKTNKKKEKKNDNK